MLRFLPFFCLRLKLQQENVQESTIPRGAYGLLKNAGTASLSDTGNTQNSLSADTSSQLTAATFNVENYFAVGSEVSPGDPSTKVTQQQFHTKTAKLSKAIRESIGTPDVLAVQEVEKIEVLNALASKIAGAVEMHIVQCFCLSK